MAAERAGAGESMMLQDDVPIIVDAFEELWRAHVPVPLPDTIVWKYGRIESWFFTQMTADGAPTVRRKRPATIRAQNILSKVAKAMRAHRRAGAPGDVVARWIGGEPGEPCRVMYLTSDALQHFLANIVDKGHGVLQRWCAQTTEHCVAARAHWSSHLFSLECRSNIHPISARHVPLPERTATFEGGTKATTVAVCNNHLRKQIEAYMVSIADAVNTRLVPTHKVWQLQVTFVPDTHGVVWLSWFSVMQVNLAEISPICGGLRQPAA